MESTEFITLIASAVPTRVGTISLDDRLEDLDWDSLANISFIAAVDEELGITLDSTRLADCTTPRELLSLVNETIIAK